MDEIQEQLYEAVFANHVLILTDLAGIRRSPKRRRRAAMNGIPTLDERFRKPQGSLARSMLIAAMAAIIVIVVVIVAVLIAVVVRLVSGPQVYGGNSGYDDPISFADPGQIIVGDILSEVLMDAAQNQQYSDDPQFDPDLQDSGDLGVDGDGSW